MTIKLVDQSLNVAIASLIYGSEIWLTCAFSLYVARRIGLKAKSQNTVSTDWVEGDALVVKPQSNLPVEKAQPDATVEKTLDKEIVTKTIVETSSVVKSNVTKQLSLEKKTTKKRSVTRELSGKAGDEKALVVTKDLTLQISCEPVNWKLWKVGDLRKASIYRACGVRIRPIGSRKNLPKANLIAQYEQNLKRLTKLPPVVAVEQHKTA